MRGWKTYDHLIRHGIDGPISRWLEIIQNYAPLNKKWLFLQCWEAMHCDVQWGTSTKLWDTVKFLGVSPSWCYHNVDTPQPWPSTYFVRITTGHHHHDVDITVTVSSPCSDNPKNLTWVFHATSPSWQAERASPLQWHHYYNGDIPKNPMYLLAIYVTVTFMWPWHHCTSDITVTVTSPCRDSPKNPSLTCFSQ